MPAELCHDCRAGHRKCNCEWSENITIVSTVHYDDFCDTCVFDAACHTSSIYVNGHEYCDARGHSSSYTNDNAKYNCVLSRFVCQERHKS